MKTSKMLSFVLVFIFFNAFTQSDSARDKDSVRTPIISDTIYYKKAMKKNWIFTLSRLRVFEKRRRMEYQSDSVRAVLLEVVEAGRNIDSIKNKANN